MAGNNSGFVHLVTIAAFLFDFGETDGNFMRKSVVLERFTLYGKNDLELLPSTVSKDLTSTIRNKLRAKYPFLKELMADPAVLEAVRKQDDIEFFRAVLNWIEKGGHISALYVNFSD